jgi:hypothetical protein
MMWPAGSFGQFKMQPSITLHADKSGSSECEINNEMQANIN